MEIPIKTRILAGMSYAQVEAHESACRFGEWDEKKSNEELAGLLHRDVSRVLEIATIGDVKSRNLNDCTALEEALADVIIRCLDIAGGKKLHVGPAVLAKLEHNEQLSLITKKDY